MRIALDKEPETLPQSRLTIPDKDYQRIIAHLLPEDSEKEQAGFVFSTYNIDEHAVELRYLDWYPIPPDGFQVQSPGYIELTDESRATVIKRAHERKAALVEAHSHPWQRRPRFSPSDLKGLDDFVPHVMWRLKNRPYAAMVVSRWGLDGLVWASSPSVHDLRGEIQVGTKSIRPTGLTLSENHHEYDY